MDLDEVVGRELYEMFRESHEDPDFPTWEEAPEYCWEAQYDEAGEEIVIDVHAHWIAQGRRVNRVVEQAMMNDYNDKIKSGAIKEHW